MRLVSANPDESSVIELTDGIITVLSLKGNDLAQRVTVLSVFLPDMWMRRLKAAAAETDAEIPDYDDTRGRNASGDSAESAEAVRRL